VGKRRTREKQKKIFCDLDIARRRLLLCSRGVWEKRERKRERERERKRRLQEDGRRRAFVLEGVWE
jgi:hypothetical protein